MRVSIHTLCGLPKAVIDACLTEALVHVRPSDARDETLWVLGNRHALADARRAARARAWRSVRRHTAANVAFQRSLIREVSRGAVGGAL